MRFSVQLPTENVHAPEEFLSAEALGTMAAAAERAGFDACWVTDHPAPDDDWLQSGGHHSLDPFVALAFAASATERIRLHTHVLVLGYRNPFMTAKSAATLDVLSGGRLILGVATGYLEGEFAALGADFEARNERADEALATMKRVWTGESVPREGGANRALPRPSQEPHPPLWVGGNARRAIRRAVEHGDGWAPFPAPRKLAGRVRTAAIDTLDDLRALLRYANEHAERVGRSERLDVCFVPFEYQAYGQEEPDPDRFLETIDELSRMGVTWLAINVPCRARAEYVEKVEAFGETILSRRP